MTSSWLTGRILLPSVSNSNGPGPRGNGRRGFTLLELVVVIAIIAILAVTGVNLAEVQSQRSRSAADELALHLGYARKLALSRERHVKVLFETSLNRYSVAIVNTNGSQAYARDPLTQNDLIVNLDDRFPNVKLSAVDFNGNNVLVFNATNGLPCDVTTNGSLAGTGTVTFASGIVVTVTPLTGYIGIR
jgi:prepilin-type N-terminal cleavage/methylation domain-containing protein